MYAGSIRQKKSCLPENKKGDGHSVVGYGIGLSLTDFFDHCDCNQDGGQRTGIFQPDKSWKGHEAFQDIQIPEYAC